MRAIGTGLQAALGNAINAARLRLVQEAVQLLVADVPRMLAELRGPTSST